MQAQWFEIRLGGAALTPELRRLVTSVKAQKHRGKADVFTVVFNDPSIVLVDDPRFTEGTKISLKMGFLQGDRAVWGHGVVKNVTCDFGSSGVPQLTLSCQDESILLTKTDKSRDGRDFDGKTDHEIVETIAQEYGLGTSIETTDKPRDFKKEPVQQSKLTDAALLTKLAERNGKKWGVESGVLWFRQHRVRPGDRCNVTLDYRIGARNLKSFKPKLRSSGPTGGRQIAAATIDPFKGEIVTARAQGDVENLDSQMGNENAEQTANFEAGKTGSGGEAGGGADPTGGDANERPRQVRIRILPDATSEQNTQTVVVPNSGAEQKPDDLTFQTRGEGTTEGIPDNKEDLEASVKSKQNQNANVLNATAELQIPVPGIRAGDWAIIRGVGDRFSGRYEIVSASFEMTGKSGPKMSLDLERKGTGAGSNEAQEAEVSERPEELQVKEEAQEGGAAANEEDRVFIPTDSTSEDDTVTVRKQPVNETSGPRQEEAEKAAADEGSGRSLTDDFLLR